MRVAGLATSAYRDPDRGTIGDTVMRSLLLHIPLSSSHMKVHPRIALACGREVGRALRCEKLSTRPRIVLAPVRARVV